MTNIAFELMRGPGSQEPPANHTIQLFGLFRVFGEPLEGEQNEPSQQTEGPASYSPFDTFLLLRT